MKTANEIRNAAASIHTFDVVTHLEQEIPMTKTPLFVAYVTGSNAVSPYARARTVTGLCLSSGSSFEPSLVCVHDGDWETAKVALFPSRNLARLAADACRWNNQTYHVAVARGQNRKQGRLVTVEDWASCQEE